MTEQRFRSRGNTVPELDMSTSIQNLNINQSSGPPTDYGSLWRREFDPRLVYHKNLKWGTIEELVLKLVVDDDGMYTQSCQQEADAIRFGHAAAYRRNFLLCYGIFEDLPAEALMKLLFVLFDRQEVKLKVSK